jgi:hypothetical protein
MPYVCIFLLIMLSRLHWIDIGHFSYLATQVYLMKLTAYSSFLVVSGLSSPKSYQTRQFVRHVSKPVSVLAHSASTGHDHGINAFSYVELRVIIVEGPEISH